MRQFLVGLLLVVVSAAQAQFRNQQLLPFPYATSVASNDVFVVGQVGVTNNDTLVRVRNNQRRRGHHQPKFATNVSANHQKN